MSDEDPAQSAGWARFGTPDREWAARLSRLHKTEIVGHPLLAFTETTSTNDVAKTLAADGAPEGLAIVARSQTQGRGRRGRAWENFPDKAVYMSVLLRPTWPAGDAGWLGILGGIAVADTVRALGIRDVTIKWPNDVLVDGRKIGGVLAEPRISDQSMEFAVVGVGLNVAQDADDWPAELSTVATSFLMHGIHVPCDRVMAELIERLDMWYRKMQGGGRESTLHDWTAWSGRGDLPVLD